MIGSTVVVEDDGETAVYLLVGSTDSDPAAGRISTVVAGRAGARWARPGRRGRREDPGRRGDRYRIVEIR